MLERITTEQEHLAIWEEILSDTKFISHEKMISSMIHHELVRVLQDMNVSIPDKNTIYYHIGGNYLSDTDKPPTFEVVVYYPDFDSDIVIAETFPFDDTGFLDWDERYFIKEQRDALMSRASRHKAISDMNEEAQIVGKYAFSGLGNKQI